MGSFDGYQVCELGEFNCYPASVRKGIKAITAYVVMTDLYDQRNNLEIRKDNVNVVKESESPEPSDFIECLLEWNRVVIQVNGHALC